MPASEQTWRDLKLMHVVFGVSSVVMLVATIWMLAADHLREWKQHQRKTRAVEVQTLVNRQAHEDSAVLEREVERLQGSLDQARRALPPEDLIQRFEDAVARDARRRDKPAPKFEPVWAAYDKLKNAPEEERASLGSDLVGKLEDLVRAAKFREDSALQAKKFKAADFDVRRSRYELAVGNEKPPALLDELQKKVRDVEQQVDELNQDVQELSLHRKELDGLFAQIKAAETRAAKELEDHRANLVRVQKAYDERRVKLWTHVVESPIIDAFGRPLKVNQLWLPKLTISINFRDVARFDRCTTCHENIDKTQAGTAADPAYPHQTTVRLTLNAPAEKPAEMLKRLQDELETLKKLVADAGRESTAAEQYQLDRLAVRIEQLTAGDGPNLLAAIYDLELADRGLIDEGDVTVAVVRPLSLGAQAQLAPGDVLVEVGDARILDRAAAYRFLTETVAWGKPLSLTVRRGLPNPYAAHPRLDLYLGSTSPHKIGDVGCTICHDGQGSGTQFKWTSHTPNDPLVASRWQREHGWFDNHHWAFPMSPQRFVQSNCLKCHHEVNELAPSERFPDPPAPTLMAGYNIVRQYGCFGCHEINGFDGPTRRVGPDLRAEPNYVAAAQSLLGDKQLSAEQREMASTLILDPANDSLRRRLMKSVLDDVQESSEGQPPTPRLSESTRKLAGLLDDVESPGKYRKVGPSLRHVASKLDFDFLYSWVRRPTDFRPDTRMPQFFGHYEHLEGEGLAVAQAYEPIEIRGIVEYLLDRSEPMSYADQRQGVTSQPSAERGKQLFQTRGCLACHKHADFPDAVMNQGPDLSQTGAKLDRKANANGGKWLYSWLRDPNNYHARTLMPNLILDPVTGPDGQVGDPAADIALYLLGSGDWKPHDLPDRNDLSADEETALDKLAKEYLLAAVPSKRLADKYLADGIPADRAGEFKGDEIELVGEMSARKKLVYVGRRALTKYGCSGCHDIPGFEAIKPIGTGLADWGRKASERLAFEQIVPYMIETHGHADPGSSDYIPAFASMAHGRETNFADTDPDVGYYVNKLLEHKREGFIWQKLRQPRSYDYKKAENKPYNDRLRMPKFNLTQTQIEQVMTFVLGLVSEPPAAEYQYAGAPRRRAIVEGERLLEKYNCIGCHATQLEKWQLAYRPPDLPDQGETVDFPFLAPHATSDQIKASLAADNRGLRRATITGLPMLADDALPMVFDEEGGPLDRDDPAAKPAQTAFSLFESVLINGKWWQAGLQFLIVPEATVEKRFPQVGGYLPNLILPAVYAAEKAVNPNAKVNEAWGWLPPPLVGEGRKVQSDWLHDFLLEPYAIRPAAVLRMPKFNLSSAEASALAAYFAAMDNAEYPYDFDARTTDSHLAAAEAQHPGRLADALKIVTAGDYCVKCHLVGDFAPEGSDRAKAPRLDRVHKRLRPDYALRWIANPVRIQPYTGMPVNIKPGKEEAQQLYHGTSEEQLDALVDLLLNYDRFSKDQIKIRDRVQPATTAASDGAAAPPRQ